VMVYFLGTHRHGESGNIYPTLKVNSPLEKLGILSALDDLEELDCFIEQIERLIEKNVPDYSQDAVIIYQPVLFGSKKSKIAELAADKRFVGVQEFDTKEFLKMCYAWRDFIKAHSKD